MAGYSPNPLIKKLGYKPGSSACLIAVPAALADIRDYPDFRLREAFAVPYIGAGPRRFDLIHWFETSCAQLQNNMPNIADALKAYGMLWISWPKKASKMPTDITENVLREVILPLGLVDVKVCAVDDVWSGLKFMWRKERRGKL